MEAFAASSLGHVGPYELLRRLATGGMSEIYEARRAGPHGFSKRIALKRILPQLLGDPELVGMFIDEARLCAQLSHPNIVQVFDFGEDEGQPYMAMELVDGTTCAQLVREVATRGETVPVALTLFIGLSIARGLEHAHEARDENGNPLRLIHRDVSPGNVLISRSGAVKLGDFGIARAAFLERRTEQGQLKGKLGYMSPEQVLGRELDERTDQFSAAIILAEMLIGRPLFGGSRDIEILVRIRDADLSKLAKHGAHIPDDVRAILLRALSRRPEDRFPATRAFVEAIENVMRRAGLVTRPAALASYLDRLGLLRSYGPANASREAEGAKNGPALARTEPREPPTVRPYAFMPASFFRIAEPEEHEARRATWYRVMLKEGEIGPVPIAEVARLFGTGAIDGATMIAEEHRPYRPARELARLDRLRIAAEQRWSEPLPNGNVERFALVRREWPQWLVELMLHRKTGLLCIRHGTRRKRVYFVDGAPESVASSRSSELLGSLLIAAGTVRPGVVEDAITLSLRHGSRLGDVLVGMGELRPVALGRALVMQVRRRFVELLSWPEGASVRFFEGVLCHDDETLPELVPPLDLVAQGIAEGYAAAELAALLEPLRESTIAPVHRAPVGLGSLRLSGRMSAVIEGIDAPRRCAEIVDDAVRDGVATEEEAHRALFVGLAMKMLVVG